MTAWPVLAVAWVGHAYILTAALNHLYGRPIPKPLLKVYRLATGVAIVGFPLLWLSAPDAWYVLVGLAFGGLVFPAVTAYRLFRPTPRCVLAERTETIDYGKPLGPAAVGDGKHRWAARLPLNDVFKVDFTDLTLAVPKLPPAWDGLTVLLLSDLHFHGTPSRAFFEAVIDKLTAAPRPDLVALAGDYLDTDDHHAWIPELLGRLSATAGKYAILGNHDKHHGPDRVRKGLARRRVRGRRQLLAGGDGPRRGVRGRRPRGAVVPPGTGPVRGARRAVPAVPVAHPGLLRLGSAEWGRADAVRARPRRAGAGAGGRVDLRPERVRPSVRSGGV